MILVVAFLFSQHKTFHNIHVCFPAEFANYFTATICTSKQHELMVENVNIDFELK